MTAAHHSCERHSIVREWSTENPQRYGRIMHMLSPLCMMRMHHVKLAAAIVGIVDIGIIVVTLMPVGKRLMLMMTRNDREQFIGESNISYNGDMFMMFVSLTDLFLFIVMVLFMVWGK